MSSSSLAGRAALRGEVDARIGACTLTVAEQLLAAASLLAADKALRTALADAGQSDESRAALAVDVFAAKVEPVTTELIAAAARTRWSDSADLVDALDELGATVAFTAAEADGSLDAVEEELFRFGRAVESAPALQMRLTDPALDASGKAQLVRDLVASSGTPTTTVLLAHMAANLRGRRVDSAITMLTNLAAAQRERVVAQVRVAVPLDASQTERLARVLARFSDRAVRLNVVVDPAVIGGAAVRLGDDVIDGTMLTRITQARRSLVG